eukprot:scaffold27248_cov133-Isochrysis_galbana.AAC.17
MVGGVDGARIGEDGADVGARGDCGSVGLAGWANVGAGGDGGSGRFAGGAGGAIISTMDTDASGTPRDSDRPLRIAGPSMKLLTVSAMVSVRS